MSLEVLFLFSAGPANVRNFFTTLLAITRLLDFWVHYPTLPYSKLKNHYSLGPADNTFIKFDNTLVKFDTTAESQQLIRIPTSLK